MADVPGKFYRATKVRTGVSPSSAGSIEGEPLPPVNPPGSSLNSVGITMPSAFTVSNSPLTANGTIGVAGAGTVAQYIRGDGSLADFPETSGGGASVSYYLNGSVSQGTIGGIAYREMNKVPIFGAGTDFTINANGYIASFITDAGDPNLLEIPGGNWNFETYFSASSGGGSPTFYLELYKVNSGGTATLIASNSAIPELIAFGTNITAYFTTLAVPTTTLALTDRLAVRYYVTHSGRTITMHTEGPHLCQIITTFTTGLTALNGLTAQVQNFAVGTTGTDFNIASATATHTFNLPTASATNRGALSSADWSTFNAKQNALTLTTTGSSGAATLIGATLNIPNYGSALSGYLPLTGGTLTGPLNGTSANFSSSVKASNYSFNAFSGGGEWQFGSDTTTGSGLYLYQTTYGYSFTLSSGGNGIFAGSVTANSFIKSGGTSSQFLKADGSVDSTSYVPSSRTITINGTSQDLSANRTFNVGTVTSVTASSPLASSGGTTPNITIQQASGSQSGFLSSTDWTTFNSKQNALTNPVTGTGTTNYLPKFTGSTTIGNSQIFDDGTRVSINYTSFPAANYRFQVRQGTNRIFGIADQDGELSIESYNDAVNAGVPLRIYSTKTQILNGNVLIGTSSDNGARLQVEHNGNSPLLISTSSTTLFTTYRSNSVVVGYIGNGDGIVTGGGATNFGIRAENDLIFTSGGNNRRMTMTSSGNVGIGTASPSDFIDASLGLAIISTSGRTGLSLGSTQGTANEVLGRLSFTNTNSTNIGSKRLAYISGIRGTTDNSAYLEFGTADNALGTQRMVISQTGNVGIGTASFPASTYKFIVRQGTNKNIAFADQDGELSIEAYNDAGNAGVPLRIYSSKTQLLNGNVLIGTTTDVGYKLNVSGAIRSTGYTFLANSGGGEWQIGSDSLTGNGLYLYQTAFGYSLRLSGNGNAIFLGSVTATSFFESSDSTLKTLIQDNYQAKGIDSVVAKLYIKNGKEEIGYFAQDLQGVLPSAVSKGSDGLLNLSYREVHTAKIAYLEEKIKQLEKKYENN